MQRREQREKEYYRHLTRAEFKQPFLPKERLIGRVESCECKLAVLFYSKRDIVF
jgi:hypothetical protein